MPACWSSPAFVTWNQATILDRLGRLVEAGQAFRGALAGFEMVGQPLDGAFVAVDLTEMLMKAGLYDQTLKIAKALTPVFEKLGSHAPASGLWLDLVALILSGSRAKSLAQVDLVRESLHKAGPIRK